VNPDASNKESQQIIWGSTGCGESPGKKGRGKNIGRGYSANKHPCLIE